VQSQPHAGFSNGLDVEPWLPVPPEHATRAVDVNEANPNSPLNFMRRLLAWRRTQPSLLTGDIRFVDAPEPVLALVRSPENGGDGKTLLCVFNLGADPVSVTLAATDSVAVATHLDPALQGQRVDQRFTLPGHGFYFGEIAA
jgi:alpha-glucosidase